MAQERRKAGTDAARRLNAAVDRALAKHPGLGHRVVAMRDKPESGPEWEQLMDELEDAVRVEFLAATADEPRLPPGADGFSRGPR
jgi:hypothetical protein